jgi:hypothetical protein
VIFPAISLRLGITNDYLQDRLREHAKSFDGLLSLIPAKVYYGEDTTVRASPPPCSITIMLMKHSGSMEEEETDQRTSGGCKASKVRSRLDKKRKGCYGRASQEEEAF